MRVTRRHGFPRTAAAAVRTAICLLWVSWPHSLVSPCTHARGPHAQARAGSTAGTLFPTPPLTLWCVPQRRTPTHSIAFTTSPVPTSFFPPCSKRSKGSHDRPCGPGLRPGRGAGRGGAAGALVQVRQQGATRHPSQPRRHHQSRTSGESFGMEGRWAYALSEPPYGGQGQRQPVPELASITAGQGPGSFFPVLSWGTSPACTTNHPSGKGGKCFDGVRQRGQRGWEAKPQGAAAAAAGAALPRGLGATVSPPPTCRSMARAVLRAAPPQPAEGLQHRRARGPGPIAAEVLWRPEGPGPHLPEHLWPPRPVHRCEDGGGDRRGAGLGPGRGAHAPARVTGARGT